MKRLLILLLSLLGCSEEFVLFDGHWSALEDSRYHFYVEGNKPVQMYFEREDGYYVDTYLLEKGSLYVIFKQRNPNPELPFQIVMNCKMNGDNLEARILSYKGDGYETLDWTFTNKQNHEK